MIFTLRTRPPCTKTAALFAGTKGILVLIYAKNVQLLVYHTTFLPFVNGKVEEFIPFVPFPGAGRGDAALRRGNAPPFSLGLAQRKRPRPVKRKALGRITLTQPCQGDRKTGVAVAGTVQTCRLVPGALYPCGAEMVLPPHLMAWIQLPGIVEERLVLLAPRVPIRYALHHRGGKSKGTVSLRQRHLPLTLRSPLPEGKQKTARPDGRAVSLLPISR